MFSARSKYDAVIQRTDSGHDSVQNTIPSRDIRSQEGILANDSNFDRNPLGGCNYGLEGGQFSI